jgi:hypothetical protein
MGGGGGACFSRDKALRCKKKLKVPTRGKASQEEFMNFLSQTKETVNNNIGLG